MLVAASVALLVIVFLGVFGGIVYWVVVSQKRARAEKQELTLELGFRPVGDSEAAIAGQIVYLHRSGKATRPYVRNIFKREDADCEVYLFDLHDGSGQSTDPLQENGVAVASSQLGLPRFSVVPEAPENKKLATIANRLLDRFALGNRRTIPVVSDSQFGQEYFLAGDRESEVRKVVTDEVLDRIAEKPYRLIEAGGHLLTYDRIVLDPLGHSSKETEVQQRVAEALEVFHLLRSRDYASCLLGSAAKRLCPAVDVDSCRDS